MLVAGAPDPSAARIEVGGIVDRLLDSLTGFLS
jgi:hypothetical protein